MGRPNKVLSRGQSTWSDEDGSATSLPRQQLHQQQQHHQQTTSSSRSACEPPARTMTTTPPTTATTTEPRPSLDVSCGGAACARGLRIGVYGWRRQCLYFLVLGLALIVILNLALTLWLLKVMEFSFEGIGSLKVIPGGVQLRGQAAVLDALIASSIKSRRGRNLMLESWSNFTASARGDAGQVLARLTLTEDKVEFMSRAFRITDPSGDLLFSANNERVVVGARTLKVTGVGGASFEGSVQTPLVSSEAGRDLRLESATRSLEVRAAQGVSVESSAGGISATCLSHLRLTSTQGSVSLDSRRIFLKGLARQASAPSLSSSAAKSGQAAGPTAGRRQQQQQQQSQPGEQARAAYQLCACADGKLFLAAPDGVCQADQSVC